MKKEIPLSPSDIEILLLMSETSKSGINRNLGFIGQDGSEKIMKMLSSAAENESDPWSASHPLVRVQKFIYREIDPKLKLIQSIDTWLERLRKERKDEERRQKLVDSFLREKEEKRAIELLNELLELKIDLSSLEDVKKYRTLLGKIAKLTI